MIRKGESRDVAGRNPMLEGFSSYELRAELRRRRREGGIGPVGFVEAGKMDLEGNALARIRMGSEMSLSYYGKPLVCTYSGGKDSDVMLELFRRSGVPFEVHHSHTTADAPQTVRHVRRAFRELELAGIQCGVDYHVRPGGGRVTMWNLIPGKLMPPTRRVRYCCSVLKETGCEGRMIATGVRWEESSGRKDRESFEGITPKKKDAIHVSDEKMLLTDNGDRRRLFERCEMKAKTAVNPIIDWSDHEVWDFYRGECKCHNPLYAMGFTRVGCIGCPMAGKARWMEFREFPRYREMYIKAFDRMLEVRRRRGLVYRNEEYKAWRSGRDVFLWWMEDKNIPGQMCLEDFIGKEDVHGEEELQAHDG